MYLLKTSLSLYESVNLCKVYSFYFCRVCSNIILKPKNLFTKNLTYSKNYSSCRNEDDNNVKSEPKNICNPNDPLRKKIKFKNYTDPSVEKFSKQMQQNKIYSDSKRISSKTLSDSDFEQDFSDDISEFDSYESQYEISDYDAITDGDPEKLKTIKLYQLEIDLMSQKGVRVPKNMKAHHWRELLHYEEYEERLRYLNYLWLNEIKDINFKRKQRVKTKIHLKQKEIKDYKWDIRGPLVYSLDYNTLFHRINASTMRRFFNFKLFQAMMFGSPLIIDMGYEDDMSRQEISRTSKQLLLLFSENRISLNPFHLIFCNVKNNSNLLEKLTVVIPQLCNTDYPFFYTNKDYLDLFPKNKLVYVTKLSHYEMSDYRHDHVYIIASFVCKKDQRITLAKAKKDNLLTVKLPLDKYLKWERGSKSLALNHIAAILNDVKDGKYWHFALQHVPRRKLIPQQNSSSHFRFGTVNTVLKKDNERVYNLLRKNLGVKHGAK